jgi:hypothetical protein
MKYSFYIFSVLWTENGNDNSNPGNQELNIFYHDLKFPQIEQALVKIYD